MKLWKRITSICLALLMLCGMLPGVCLSASAENHTGTCGEGVIWTLYEGSGILMIEGEGAMQTYPAAYDVPWYDYADLVREVAVDDGVASLDLEAFSPCTKLAAFSVGDDNPQYSADAQGLLFDKTGTRLLRCPVASPITAYTVPDSVTVINSRAFYDCRKLTDIVVPPTVTSIGEIAFFGCAALVSAQLPESLRSVNWSLFYGCAALTTVNIPQSASSIGSAAFYGCKSLSAVTIPAAVTTIGKRAFAGCKSITAIRIPAKTSSIGDDAFADCTALTRFTVDAGNTKYTNDAEGVLFSNAGAVLVQYPAGKTQTTYAMPSAVTAIKDKAFANCTKLTAVSLSENLTQIGASAFSGCTGLRSVALPDRTSALGESAFAGCTRLTSLDLPNGLETIGASAFSGCSALQNLTMQENVTEIGRNAFQKCSHLAVVCYGGTEAQWNGISIASGNTPLTGAARYYHKHNEETPTEIRGAVPATCTADGYSGDVVYAPCGVFKAKGETLPATKHNYVSETLAPTCTQSGCTRFTCQNCGDFYDEDPVPALGHAWGAWEDENSTQHIRYCSRDQSHTEYAPHEFALNTELTIYESCTDDGLHLYDCTVCNHRIEVTVPAVGHAYAAAVTVPTCEAEGYTTYTCTRCGDTYTGDAVPAKGHAWNDGTVTASPTCTADGTKMYVCTACEKARTEALPALGHDYNAAVTAPTCEADGYTTYTCTRCGDTYTGNSVPAKGHTWNEGAVTTAPTCTTAGEKVLTCTVCGQTETEALSALGHAYDAAVTPPTCETDGFTAYTCTRCGDTYTGDPVPAKGHVWNEGAVTTAPTCTAAGEKTLTCTVCGQTETEALSALGHAYDAVVTPPTFEAGGYTTYICTRCGDTYTADSTPVKTLTLNHTALTLVYRRTDTLTVLEGEAVTWTSSNEKAVKVDANGNLKTVRRGTAVITAHPVQGGSKTASCTVKVKYLWWQWLIKIFLFGFIWY